MGRYLIQAAYTPDSWTALVQQPENRATPVRRMVERAGGRLECFYLSFGDYDIVSIAEFPDNASAAAVSIAASAGRGIKTIRTTPLLSVEETIGALTKAQVLEYEPPGHGTGMQTPMYAG
jgi:uncharacterized protein with GYD domain